ncbi:MAG: dicarboxylate/amino acid:cation symporter, partial [Planctomycetota bacterium]
MKESASSAPRSPWYRALHWQILIGLILGAGLGIAANYLASVPQGSASDADANGIHDRLDWWVVNVTEPVGRVFLRLIFMVVIPLVFSALAMAVVELGDWRKLGRVGVRTIVYTLVLSSAAVFIGVGLANLLQPGRTLSPAQRALLNEQYGGGAEATVFKAKQAKPLRDVLLDIIPENPLQEMVGALDGSSRGGGMLAVMFFALATGAAITASPERCRTLTGVLEGLQTVSMNIIGFAMYLAPLGVACLVFGVTARLGWGLFPPLLGFLGTVFLGFALQLFVVYPALIWFRGGISPLRFFARVSDAMLTAFGTSSSNVTLPVSMRVAEQDLKLPREISRFVLTVGATGNQNGTALFEGAVVLFLAQAWLPDGLTLAQQFQVVLMAVLAGVGTAGVPGGSLPLIVIVLETVGVPGESIGVVLGIDRLLDMSRTVLNVTGDLAIATCVAAEAPAGEVERSEDLAE